MDISHCPDVGTVQMRKYEESAQRLIKGRNIAFLSTINPDGSPHVTPIWIDGDNRQVLINTVVGRVKERNMKRNPVVAISIAQQENSYNMVTMRGKVVEAITGPEAEGHIDYLARKYLGVNKNPYRRPGQRRILFKVEIEWISGAV